jgi:starvation-inducible DNA-binding protein
LNFTTKTKATHLKENNMLIETLKKTLASSYVYQLKARQFHWNVESANFNEYHDFFDELSTEVYASTDKNAEFIRVLDDYAPGSLTRFQELSIIGDQNKIPRAELMIFELYQDTVKMVELFKAAFDIAEEAREQGVADYIASRIDAFGKHAWKLRSMLKARE